MHGYLNISGRAGCGKSAFLNCVSEYIKDEAEDEWDFGSTWNPESIPLLQRTIGTVVVNI